MGKITIAGDALVITSSKSLADIQVLEKHNPQALELRDAKGETVIFKVGTTTGKGSINQFGASFDGVSHDDKKLATITFQIPKDVENAEEYAADLVGSSILSLNKVETGFDAALAKVKADKDAVMKTISVIN